MVPGTEVINKMLIRIVETEKKGKKGGPLGD